MMRLIRWVESNDSSWERRYWKQFSNHWHVHRKCEDDDGFDAHDDEDDDDDDDLDDDDEDGGDDDNDGDKGCSTDLARQLWVSASAKVAGKTGENTQNGSRDDDRIVLLSWTIETIQASCICKLLVGNVLKGVKKELWTSAASELASKLLFLQPKLFFS